MTDPFDEGGLRFVTGVLGAVSVEAFLGSLIGWLVTGAPAFAWAVLVSAGGVAGYGTMCYRRARRARR